MPILSFQALKRIIPNRLNPDRTAFENLRKEYCDKVTGQQTARDVVGNDFEPLFQEFETLQARCQQHYTDDNGYDRPTQFDRTRFETAQKRVKTILQSNDAINVYDIEDLLVQLIQMYEGFLGLEKFWMDAEAIDTLESKTSLQTGRKDAPLQTGDHASDQLLQKVDEQLAMLAEFPLEQALAEQINFDPQEQDQFRWGFIDIIHSTQTRNPLYLKTNFPHREDSSAAMLTGLKKFRDNFLVKMDKKADDAVTHDELIAKLKSRKISLIEYLAFQSLRLTDAAEKLFQAHQSALRRPEVIAQIQQEVTTLSDSLAIFNPVGPWLRALKIELNYHLDHYSSEKDIFQELLRAFYHEITTPQVINEKRRELKDAILAIIPQESQSIKVIATILEELIQLHAKLRYVYGRSSDLTAEQVAKLIEDSREQTVTAIAAATGISSAALRAANPAVFLPPSSVTSSNTIPATLPIEDAKAISAAAESKLPLAQSNSRARTSSDTRETNLISAPLRPTRWQQFTAKYDRKFWRNLLIFSLSMAAVVTGLVFTFGAGAAVGIAGTFAAAVAATASKSAFAGGVIFVFGISFAGTGILAFLMGSGPASKDHQHNRPLLRPQQRKSDDLPTASRSKIPASNAIQIVLDITGRTPAQQRVILTRQQPSASIELSATAASEQETDPSALRSSDTRASASAEPVRSLRT